MWHLMDEAAIQLGGKAEKYGNILILAGGAGSGKGFAYDMAIDFDGKKFDVDDLKAKMMKFGPGSVIDKKFFERYGTHLKDMDLKDPEDTKTLHEFADYIGWDKKRKNIFFNNVKLTQDKPNVIFDVTLKDYSKLINIATLASSAGYDTNKMHLVWILNEFDMAVKQNMKRSRQVPVDLLSKTHVGVSDTLRKVLDKSMRLSDNTDGSIINGDIWVFFNKSGTDNFVRKSGHGGMEMSDINAVRIKEAGKPMPEFNEIMDMKVKEFDANGKMISRDKITLRDKIAEYVPEPTRGMWKRLPEDNPEEEDEYGDNTRHNL